MQFQTFQWVMDINADGHVSLWEIWETIRWIFRIPGSLAVEFLGQFPSIAKLLNLQTTAATGYASLTGLLAKTLSLLFWLPLFVGLLTLSSPPKRRHNYLDENSKTQPLLLPIPKDYSIFRSPH